VTLSELLAQLIDQRAQVLRDLASAQEQSIAVLMTAKEENRESLRPDELHQLSHHIDTMRTLGAQVVRLDERIADVDAEVRRGLTLPVQPSR
jgi:hypothetical protein